MAAAMRFALRSRRQGRSAGNGAAGWLVLLPLFLMMLPTASSRAASIIIEPPQVLDNGGVVVSATGTFATCTTCDANGENCVSNDSGAVLLKRDNAAFYYPECVKRGNGSATCTYTYDRGLLHGDHTFYAKATDCTGTATTSVSLTLDNTPVIQAISPGGATLNAPFDITARVSFSPTLNTTKGAIYAYLVWPSGAATFLRAKSCTNEECGFSYQELTRSLYDLNHGGPYKIKIRATGGGASSEKEGEPFYIDKTPAIGAITPGGTTLHAPFDITASATFKPTLSTTKGTIYAYLVWPSGAATYLRAKSCTSEECGFSYQELAGSLYDLNHGGPYKIKIRATGSGASSEKEGEPFSIDKTPAIGAITPGGATLDAPFDITASATFKPTLSTTKGTISAWFVLPNGAMIYQGGKTCTTLDCDYSYQAQTGTLYDYYHGGPYKIKITASGSGTSVTELGEEFYIDKTPSISSITPGGGTVDEPFDITARAAFKETTNVTKGTISAWFVLPSGAMISLGGKTCTTLDCDYSYQAQSGTLYDYYHGGPYKIKITASGSGTSVTELGEEFYIDKTPSISSITPGGGTVDEPFDITARAAFKETTNVTKGTISAWFVLPNGAMIYQGGKTCTVLDCDYSYQEQSGTLYDYYHGGPYKIKITASGGGTSLTEYGEEFYIDKTPHITPIEPAGKTQSPINIQANVTFRPTLSATKGSIYAYLVYSSGSIALLGSKSCATEECTYNYQEITGNLYRLSPGRYQLKFKATGSGASAEAIEPFEVVEYADNSDGPCQSRPLTKNPINYATGNKFFQQQDLRIDGPGLPFAFSRYYNSRREAASAAGYGWSTSFSRHLEFPSATTITLVHDRGSETTFRQNAEGIFVSITDEVQEIEAVAEGYALTLPDGGKNYFSSSGLLSRIENRQGNAQFLDYEGGRLVAVEDTFGRRLDFFYDATGKLATVSAPMGDYRFFYDGNGNLVEVVSPVGTGKKYVYEDTNDIHNLTAIVDENDMVEAAVTYDRYDRAVTSELADGLHKVTVTYLASQTRILTDARNASKTVELHVDANGIVRKQAESGPGCTTCPAASGVSYLFDDRLRITRATDALGRVTTSTYDERGNKISETEALATAEERTTTFTYHPDDNQVTSITRASVARPGAQTVTTFTYDANGNLASRTESGYNGAAMISATTSYAYNDLGQLVAIDGPRTDVADVTTFSYYANVPEEGANRGQLRAVTNALSQKVTFTRYNAFGKAEEVIDENGVVTTFTYDEGARLIETSTLGRSTVLRYDAAGRLTSVLLPGDRVISYAYTAANLLATIADSLGNSISYSYDSEGNRIREEVRDPANALAASLDFDYDDDNRLARIILPGGAVEEHLYDSSGNLEQLIDPNGLISRYDYDALDRLVTHYAPDLSATAFNHDSADNLAEVRDAEGTLTRYHYDDLGRRVAEHAPDADTTTFTYDAAGNLIRKTDARGVTVTFAYDAMNRLIAEQYPDASQNITYSYDQGINGVGRLTGMTDASGATAYRYNEVGQLVNQERVNDGMPTASLRFVYDGTSGELAGITYPSGLHVSYGRDADGKVSAMVLDGREIVSNITYKPFGPVAGYNVGESSVAVLRTYDQQYRLTGTEAAAVYGLSLVRDGAGNVLAILDVVDPAADQSFAYDSLYRLIDAAGIYGGIGYTYDRVGNRQTRISETEYDIYSYLDDSNQLLTVTASNPATYTYDAHGTIIGNGTLTFVYDQANRLTVVREGESLVSEYGYDGRNMRVKKTVNGRTTFCHYDPQGKLLAETDGSGNPLRDYIYLDDEPVAMTIYGEQAGIYYFLTDHLGTPQKLIDETGQVVWQANYLPFGQAMIDPASTVENNFRFPGQYFDQETGLHYNWNRYYDPGTGRYLTPDPIGLAGGINLYSYALQNPVNFIDPFGLAPWYNDPNHWTAYSFNPANPVGPFGPVCGPSGSKLATWIPDVTSNACRDHDKCYEECANNCEGEDCRLKCDNQLKKSNFPYGKATDIFGKTIYDKLKDENGCNECN
ncbi:MAG: RHS repeat-associated core domain-containing protein [Thermodesulfobacteriota bacterium]